MKSIYLVCLYDVVMSADDNESSTHKICRLVINIISSLHSLDYEVILCL